MPACRLLPVLLLLCLLAACNQGVSDRSLEYVTASEAGGLLDRRGGILGLGGETDGAFVDPRGAGAWAEGHIPGAIHLPFQHVTTHRDRLAGLDTIIVYGTGWNDPLAEGMSKRLLQLGFKNVRTLRGGLDEWAAGDHDVARGSDGAFAP